MENRQILERDDLGPPVVPGGQEIGLGSRNLRPRAEARPTGRAVSRERLGDWDRTEGDLSPLVSARRRATWPKGDPGQPHTTAEPRNGRVPTAHRRCRVYDQGRLFT